MSTRQDSWKAIGLVEKAWKRLDPPTRDELARRLDVKPTNLSKLNTGALPMTTAYAQRIKKVVRGLTLADLGAPTAAVAEEEPTVLRRLQSLEAEVELWKGLLLEALGLQGLQVNPEADQGSRVQRTTAAAGARRGAPKTP